MCDEQTGPALYRGVNPGFQHPDGTLRLVEWANRGAMVRAPHAVTDGPAPIGHHALFAGAAQALYVPTDEHPTRMAHSTASGRGLVSNGYLGVDAIRLAAGHGFVPHTHPGDHLLIVTGGVGTITYDGRIYQTSAGQVYMVEGRLPHAVGAITDHTILAVGAPHKAVDDTDRMQPVEYQTILTANLGALHCLICDLRAVWPNLPHDGGCPHCPCPLCVTTGDAAEDDRLRTALHIARMDKRTWENR